MWRLHNLKELDCEFFQGFCEEGHYGGRARPTSTRQGIYCCTPSGRFLASINTTDPKRMAGMLRTALEKYADIPKKERLLDYDPATRAAEIRRREQQYPEDGLPLRVFTRDWQRPDLPDDWRGTAWNVDSLWYRKAEARELLPQKLKAGESIEWPRALIERLVRHNLVDNVRGQTNGYRANHVRLAKLTTTITAVKGNLVTVTLAGASRAFTSPKWPEKGTFAEVEEHGPHTRGVQTTMYGEASFDKQSGRFTKFELVAAGTRFGQTRYNFRHGDLDEAPIAFVIRFDPEDEGRRVAPAEMGAYSW